MRTPLIVTIVALLALVLTLAGAFAPGHANWGVHHYGFLGTGWLLLGLVLALVGGLLVLGGDRVARGLAVPGVLLAAASFGVLFWLARARAYFLGDGLLLVRALEGGRAPWENAPLPVLAAMLLHRSGVAADTAFALLSVASGVAFVLLAGWFARIASSDAGGRLLVFLVIVTAGLTRLFYGYVETYPILAGLVMLYAVLGTAVIRSGSGRGLLAAGLVFLFTVPAHVTAVALLPSLVYLAAVTGDPTGRGRRVALALGIPLVVMIGGALVLWGDLGRFGETLRENLGLTLPLAGIHGDRIAYTLLSPAHFRDFFQEQLLLGPAAALLAVPLLLLAGRPSRPVVFLFVAGLPWWVVSFLYNRAIGAARDWDLFAAASVPLLLAAAWILSQPSASRRLRPAAALLVAVSVFHLVPWVAVGADAAASRERLRTLFAPEAKVSPFAVQYVFEQIGTEALDRGDVAVAEESYTRAWLATRNPRLGGNLGALLVAQGKVDEALKVLWQAADRDTTNEVVWFQLAGALVAKGDVQSAREAYDHAIAENGNYLQAYLAAARLQRQLGALAEAESLLVEARRRFPEDGEAANNLALLYQITDRPDEAVELYEYGLARKPDDTGSRFNLGRILLEQERPEEAARVFEEVLTWTPEDVEAWVNLGAAWEKLGKADDARTAFEHAKELAPRRPEPYFNLARLDLAADDRPAAMEQLRQLAAIDSTSREGLRARLLLKRLGAEDGKP